MQNKSKLVQSVEGYVSRTSIHGLAYIFDKSIGYVDSGLWILIVSISMALAMWSVTYSYINWKENQVINTLKTTNKPVTEIDFPTVTICLEGQHMELVDKVLYNNFNHWRKLHDNNNSLQDDFSDFMLEYFQITDKDTNILDILNTMISPESSAVNEVREHRLACEEKSRRKREVPINSFVAATTSKKADCL